MNLKDDTNDNKVQLHLLAAMLKLETVPNGQNFESF